MLLKTEELNKLSKDRYKKLLERSQVKIDGLFGFVKGTVDDIQKRGDKALCEYIRKYDKVNLRPENLIVTKKEIAEAARKLPSELKEALNNVLKSIQSYHTLQLQEKRLGSWYAPKGDAHKKKENPLLGRNEISFDKAGIYVPGGKREKDCYPVTAIMAVTPAKLVGVKEIVVCTPPKKDGTIPPAVLYACDISGADKIIKVGGAQAIAALACGTETIPRVDIIVGPGNIYVTAAKSYVAANGFAAIDFPAGPSEILIIADDSADPEFIVSDMFAQAEHDENACAILITTSKQLAKKVSMQIDARIKKSDRAEIIKNSLKNYGTILIANNVEEMVDFCNEFAPEHLEVMVKNDDRVAKKIRNVGLVCLGSYTPVAAADYFSGTNHILPTGGAARWASSLAVENFIKRIPIECLNRKTMIKMYPTISTLSKVEGLYSAHGVSIKNRVDKLVKGQSAVLKNPRLFFDKKMGKILPI